MGLEKKSWPSEVGWVRARRREVRVCRMGVVDGLGGGLSLGLYDWDCGCGVDVAVVVIWVWMV